MPATNYKLITIAQPVGKGVMQSAHIQLAGIGKKASPAFPYSLANELVCNRIANMLLLPCPPGAFTEHGGDSYFFTLNFNLSGQSLPPADSVQIVADKPRNAWQIIAFDVLIMNNDRHSDNLSYDTTSKALQIYDHGHAFLGPSGDIPARLGSTAGQLAIGGHCLAAEIATDDGKDDAIARVQSVPDFFIEEVLTAATTVGLPPEHRDACASHLKTRRDNLGQIINGNLGSFPKLPRTAP